MGGRSSHNQQQHGRRVWHRTAHILVRCLLRPPLLPHSNNNNHNDNNHNDNNHNDNNHYSDDHDNDDHDNDDDDNNDDDDDNDNNSAKRQAGGRAIAMGKFYRGHTPVFERARPFQKLVVWLGFLYFIIRCCSHVRPYVHG